MKIDAANWEQMEQGRDDFFLPGGTLDRERLKSRDNLPEFIRRFLEEKERGIPRPYAYDRLWELYYRWMSDLARSSSSRFLSQYLSWEIDLEMHLAVVRAARSGAGPDAHPLPPSLHQRSFSELAARLGEADNPLTAERLLDEERLRQISREEGIDSFSLDALLAYVLRAMLYGRWERMTRSFDVDGYLQSGVAV
jgi:hypothetical protein